MRPGLFGRLDRGFKVADIVERVENTDDVDAVVNRFFDEVLHCIVRIVAVAEHILPTEKHLELGVRHIFADQTQTLPRVLAQKADAGIKCCTAPALAGIEADLIHRRKDREHLVHAHAGGDQRLMRVTQDGFADFHLLCHLYSLPYAIEISRSFELTASPFFTWTPTTVPETGAKISFSIFIASSTSSMSFALT